MAPRGRSGPPGKGSGLWYADQAWLGRRAEHVLIEVQDGRITAITEGVPAPSHAVVLTGWTIPGLANVHSHAFQRGLRGTTESSGGDFWEWRRQMYDAAKPWDQVDYLKHCMSVFKEMLEAGITAVGEFHYLRAYDEAALPARGNGLGEMAIAAAYQVGIRITLLDACYLRGGLDGRPLEGVQQSFSDGDADHWTRRMDELREHLHREYTEYDFDSWRIGAAIHSVRAVDPASMRIVAKWAREHEAPLHIQLAEQPAEVEECIAVEGCTPTELLEREGILGPDLTAVHAIHVNEHDISLLGRHHVSICGCPTTERDLGDRVGPIRALADAGCPVTVGSDSNAMIDILEEARGLELDQRRATGRRVMHQPEELLGAATANGMRALGWEAGELKPGMLADFITLDQPRQAIWRHLDAGYLIYGYSGCDVTNVVVAGKTVMSK